VIGPVVLAGGLAVIVVVAIAVMSPSLLATSRPSGEPPAKLPGSLSLPSTRARSRATRFRVTGLLAGVVVAALAGRTGTLGRGVMLAVPLGALLAMAGVLVGELAVRRPTTAARRASIRVRRVRDHLPRTLTIAVGAATLALAALLSATAATGSADDMGRGGRSLAWRCASGVTGSAGPWAGSFYALPLALVVLTGLAAAGLTLHRVVRRPRGEGLPAAEDDALRDRSAVVVTGAFGALVTVPLAGVCLVTGGALLSAGCRPLGWSVAGWSVIAAVPASLALLTVSLAAVLTPAERTPR